MACISDEGQIQVYRRLAAEMEQELAFARRWLAGPTPSLTEEDRAWGRQMVANLERKIERAYAMAGDAGRAPNVSP